MNSINDLREKIHDVKSNRDEITVPDEYENSREYFLRKNLDQEFFHEHACLNKDLVEIYSR